jgi:hypothetical protein
MFEMHIYATNSYATKLKQRRKHAVPQQRSAHIGLFVTIEYSSPPLFYFHKFT